MPSSPSKCCVTMEELSTERKKKKKNDSSVAHHWACHSWVATAPPYSLADYSTIFATPRLWFAVNPISFWHLLCNTPCNHNLNYSFYVNLLVITYVMIYTCTLFHNVYGILCMHYTCAREKMLTVVSKVWLPPLAALQVLQCINYHDNSTVLPYNSSLLESMLSLILWCNIDTAWSSLLTQK